MFPEYVERYNHHQQQLSAQIIPEQVSQEASQVENKPMLENVVNPAGENVKRVDTPRDRRKDRKQSFPTWMMLLLVSIFGIVMALPLLQL